MVALIGTIITIYFGYRQWKKQQDTSRYSTFVTEKHAAYKMLWEKLEEVHIKLRTDSVSYSDFNNLVREVNSYILKNALYLEEQDKELSNQYLKSVFRFKEIISESGDDDAQEAMNVTGNMPLNTIKKIKELQTIMEEVNKIRGTIIERFKKIIGGNLS